MWCWWGWGGGGGQHPYCCQANVSSSYFKKKTSHREMKRATGGILSSGGFLTTHTCASARLRTQFRQTGPECGEARPLQTDTYNTVVVFSPHIGRRNQQIAHHFELVFSFFFAHGSAHRYALKASIKFNCPANVSAWRRARDERGRM